MKRVSSARPFIASFVIFRKQGKIAFVLRKNTSWMNNYYGLPSGKVEEGESFSQAAALEAKEEVGVRLAPKNLRPLLTVHRVADDETRHWVDVYFEADEWEGELVNAEPDKHSEVEWFHPNDLPDNVIPHVKHALEQIESGRTYSEYGWPEMSSLRKQT